MNTDLAPTTALIPHSDAGADARSEALPPSVFTRFLQTLQGLQEPVHTDPQTRVSHCGVPLERILFSGVWVLMRKLSTQLELPLSTTTDALILAERINRLICAGMLLEYGSAEAAARAFWREVVELVDTAHTLGYQPGMQVSARTWGILLRGNTRSFQQELPVPPAEPKGFVDGHWRAPCMLFLAKLFKRARTYCAELRILQRELEEINNPNMGVVKSEDLHRMGSAQSFAELMARESIRNGFSAHEGALDLIRELGDTIGRLDHTVSNQASWSPDQTRVKHREHHHLNERALMSLSARVRNAVGLCRLWNRFSLRHKTWPVASTVILDHTWLKSQILLSLLGADGDSDALDSVRSLNRALALLKGQDDGEVLRLAWCRLCTRLSSELSREDASVVKDQILNKITAMRESAELSEPTPTTIGDPASSITGYLVHLRDSDIFLDPIESLRIALGQESEALASATSELLNSGENAEALLTRVALSILWSNLDPETLMHIVRAGVLKPVDIMDGLDALSSQDVRSFVRELVSRNEDDYPLQNLVMSKGYQLLSIRQLRRIVPHLNNDNVDRVADRVFVPGEEIGAQQQVLALLVLAHLSPSSHQRRLREESWRIELAMMGTPLLQDHEATVRTYDAIRERMGDDYINFVLASAAWSRWIDPNDPDDHVPESPWEDTFQTHGDPFIPPRVMGPRFTPEDGRALCLQITEEEALAWTSSKED